MTPASPLMEVKDKAHINQAIGSSAEPSRQARTRAP